MLSTVTFLVEGEDAGGPGLGEDKGDDGGDDDQEDDEEANDLGGSHDDKDPYQGSK